MIETRMRNDEDRDDDRDKEAAGLGAPPSSVCANKRIPPEGESCYSSPNKTDPKMGGEE